MTRLDQGRIRSGFDLKLSDICRTFTRPAALYIAMIYGGTRRERAFMLAALQEHLLSFADWQRPQKVYARAATRHGAHLLRKNGFDPLAGNADIFVVDYAHLAKHIAP